MKYKYSFLFYQSLICILSFLLFHYIYTTDNKYSEKTLVASNGILNLSQNDFTQNSVFQLSFGWDVYPNEYVSYNEISSKKAPLNIFIGQYSGLDFGTDSNPYFGKATYHLKIFIPKSAQLYTLEIPEIFSAYKLYINGSLMSQCGNINEVSYKAATKNSTISFLAKDSLDIIFHVANYSHVYGGVVYPPAFGSQNGISNMILIRIVFRSMLIFVSLSLSILFFLAGLKTNKVYIVYSILALVFVGYIDYPIIHSIFTTGIGIYKIEIFCYYLFMTLILYIQNNILFTKDRFYNINTNNLDKKNNIGIIFMKLFFCFSILILLSALLPAKVICLNRITLKIYTSLLTFYKYSIFLYLIISTFITSLKNIKYSKMLLSGFCIVGVSLLTDRIYTLFEPIRFGWFYELSGFILLCIIGLILALSFSEAYVNNQKLNAQIDMQKDYYTLVTENIYNTRKMRHNLKNHILVIKRFLEEQNTEELFNYIQNYADEFPTFKELIFCENKPINILISYYVNLAQNKGITVNVRNFNIPENINISNPDLCVIFGNLFTNAIEACDKITDRPAIINISSKIIFQNLSITFDNTYSQEPIIINESILSSKRINKEGIGIPSIKKIISKYDGYCKFQINNSSGFFEVSLLLTQKE